MNEELLSCLFRNYSLCCTLKMEIILYAYYLPVIIIKKELLFEHCVRNLVLKYCAKVYRITEFTPVLRVNSLVSSLPTLGPIALYLPVELTCLLPL